MNKITVACLSNQLGAATITVHFTRSEENLGDSELLHNNLTNRF